MLANLGAEGGGALTIRNMDGFENENWEPNCRNLDNSDYDKIRHVDSRGQATQNIDRKQMDITVVVSDKQG